MAKKLKADKGLKPVTKDVAEGVLFKIDMEGIWYALQEGYCRELHGTVLEPLMEAAAVSMRRFENALETIREQHGIQVS